MYWFRYLLVQAATFIAIGCLVTAGGYWRAFGWLLIIPVSPLFITSVAGRLSEMEIYGPAELLLWVSMALQKFLNYLPFNPWSYGIRYPLDQLAELCLRCERFAESEEYAEQAILMRKDEKSASHPKILLTLTESLRAQSKLIASEDYAKKSLDMAEAAALGYVPDKWMLPLQARAHKELSLIKLEEGLCKEAEDSARYGLRILADAPTNVNLTVYELVREYCSILSTIAYVDMAREQAEEALGKFKRVENIARKAFVREHELQVKAMIDGAAAAIKLERFDEAEKSLEQAKQILQKSKYSNSVQADLDYTLGVLNLNRTALPEAEKLFLSALSKREKIYGKAHPWVSDVCLSLARTKFEAGRSADAEMWLKRAIDSYSAQEPINRAKITSAISLSKVWRSPISEPEQEETGHSPLKDPEHGGGQ